MKYHRTTKKFIQNELYKLCVGTDTATIIDKYSYKSRWHPHDIIKRLIQACLEQTSLEDICSTTAGPSADTVHRRCSELEISQIEKLVNSWLIEVASRLKIHHKTKITLAFDLYEQPFYGNPSFDWVIGTKRKKGTNYAITFLIVSIATKNIRCPVGVRLMTSRQLKTKVIAVSQILDELLVWLPVKRVLFDRGFCQEDILQLMEDRGLEYVIAAIRHSRIKQASQEIWACVQQLAGQAGIDVSDHLALGRWVRKRGLDTFRVEHVSTGKKRTPVPLVAAFVRQRTNHRNPLKRAKYCLFLYLTNTTVTPRTVVRLYSKRWIVETDIRCINEFTAVTNSILPQLRLLFYGLAMVFDALWIVFSTLINRFTEEGTFSIPEWTQFVIKQRDTLQCIARYFLRLLRNEILPLLIFPGGDA
ncbi:MAG: transposase [Candidatus Hodarchaeales archaeon]|jgi:hypothetical protein